MKTILSRIPGFLISQYKSVISSIAFYPSIISLAFLIFAVTILKLESHGFTQFLNEQAPYLVINNAETSRVVLGTLIGGIISLTVFSFSMVMVLLNQASSNFSPRLLPGLITDSKNQIVLGFYIGTIIYNIIVLISILPDGDEYTLNGFSILVGIILGMICLGLFVFFIHTMSQKIQVNVIIADIFEKCKAQLTKQIERKDVLDRDPDSSSWEELCSGENGYLVEINLDRLKYLATEYQVDLHIKVAIGEYVRPDKPALFSSRPLKDEEKEAILSIFVISHVSDTANHYETGIKQLTEVGIKAMSPGINDPGTAIITLDYLTELFALRMKFKDRFTVYSNEEKQVLVNEHIGFEKLLYRTLAVFRQYCKHDVIMMEKMMNMLSILSLRKKCEEAYQQAIEKEMDTIKSDVDRHIENDFDQQRLKDLF